MLKMFLRQVPGTRRQAEQWRAYCDLCGRRIALADALCRQSTVTGHIYVFSEECEEAYEAVLATRRRPGLEISSLEAAQVQERRVAALAANELVEAWADDAS